MRTCRFFPSLVLLAALALPLAARAKTDPVFLAHYEQAMALYRDGRLQEAIPEFEAAYAIRQLPRLLFNLGQSHRKLGQAREALRFYDAYLEAVKTPPEEIRDDLEAYRAQVRAMLEATRRADPPPAADVLEAEPAPASTPGAPRLETAAPPAAVAVAPLPAGERRPLHRRWWFWTTLSVAAAGLAAGAAVLARRPWTPGEPGGIEIQDVRF